MPQLQRVLVIFFAAAFLKIWKVWERVSRDQITYI